MKISLIFFYFLLLFDSAAAQDSSLRKINNEAFTAGEVLLYRVHYGFMDAGEARLEIKSQMKEFGGRSVYHVVGTGYTKGAFNWFFKVNDHYESFIDSQSIIPWYFVRKIEEGGYKKSQHVSFNHYKNLAISEKATITTPENIQDIVSAYYYARTHNFDTLKAGDVFPMSTYLDDEVIKLNLKFIGRETIKTQAGTFNCLKFRPGLLVGRLFKDEEDMTLWISDDKNKVVIRAQADILVGSLKMDIKSYEGLTNPFSAMVK